MKIVSTIALIFLLSVPAFADKHLFILSGQSNMAGMKPEISFTPALTKAFGADNIIVVKSSKAGQPIKMWIENREDDKGDKDPNSGVQYKLPLDAIHAGFKDQKIKTATFLWMQGEADANPSSAAVYRKSFDSMTCTTSKMDTKSSVIFSQKKRFCL